MKNESMTLFSSVMDCIEETRQKSGYYDNLHIDDINAPAEVFNYEVGDVVRLKKDANLIMNGFVGQDVVILSVKYSSANVKLLNEDVVCTQIINDSIERLVTKNKFKKMTIKNIDNIVNLKTTIKNKVSKLVNEFGLYIHKPYYYIRVPMIDGLDVSIESTHKKVGFENLIKLLKKQIN